MNIKIFHNSHDLNYRNPFGAVKVKDKVSLSLTANVEGKAYIYIIDFNNNKIKLLMGKDKDNVDNNYRFSIDIDTRNLLGVNKYYFEFIYNNEVFYYGNNEEELGGIGKLYRDNPKGYQITVYKYRKVPSWYKEGVVYQIFVDRFFNGNEDKKINNPKKNSFIYATWEDEPIYVRSNNGDIARWDFYGGNLKGIIKKLSYIKSLGVSIIYMNPIFEAVSCHKYDTGDYEKIDGMFGTEEDFKNLCNEAKKIGIEIILDGVFSHTGCDSKYFNKYGTYKGLGAYQSKDSKYFSWYRFNEYPYKYDCWWGFENQPNVNELNEDYINYIVKNEDSIIEKWMKSGASGWRLDVADELPDEFIRIIKEKMISLNKESVLIGEVWEDASNKVSYSEKRKYFFGDELDSVTNYPLRDIIIGFLKRNINKNQFIKKLMSLYENYPIENFYSSLNLLGNHDTERILFVLEGNLKLLRLAILFQMTLPGVPLIYYGDEVGLSGGKDPENRKSYPWGREDFNILNLYKELIEIRNKENCLRRGSFAFVYEEDDLLIYERKLDNEKIVIIINPYDEEKKYKLNFNGSNICNVITKESYSEELELNLKEKDFKIIKIVNSI